MSKGKINLHSRLFINKYFYYDHPIQSVFKNNLRPRDCPSLSQGLIWIVLYAFSVASSFLLSDLVPGPNTDMQTTDMTVPSRALREEICLFQCLNVQDIENFPLKHRNFIYLKYLEGNVSKIILCEAFPF